MENTRYFVFNVFLSGRPGTLTIRDATMKAMLYPTEQEQRSEALAMLVEHYRVSENFNEFHVTHPIELSKEDFERRNGL